MLAILKRAAKIVNGGGKPHYTKLAQAIGCPRSALYSYRQVPAHFVLAIERATDGEITREALRPDLFAAPRPKKAK